MIKITENKFEYNNLGYFRGNAHLVELATYGEKKDPIGAKAYIDPYGKVKREYLNAQRVVKGLPIAVDWSQTSKADFGADVTFNAFGLNWNVFANYGYDKIKEAKLKLYSLSMPIGPMITMLNTDASVARNYLADEGADGRIVSEVWVLMEGALADHFSSSTSLTVGQRALDLAVTASGGTQGTQTIVLSAGTTFAYGMHKVSDWNSGKTRVEAMEDDKKGWS